MNSTFMGRKCDMCGRNVENNLQVGVFLNKTSEIHVGDHGIGVFCSKECLFNYAEDHDTLILIEKEFNVPLEDFDPQKYNQDA